MTLSHFSKGLIRPVSGVESGGRRYTVVTAPSHRGEGWGGVCSPFSVKKPLHPSLHGAWREILVSSRLGPRMESPVNMNEQAHDNMSAPPRQNDGDDGCSKCTATSPILII